MRARLAPASTLAAATMACVFSSTTMAADRFEAFRFFDEVRIGAHTHNITMDEGDSFDVSGQILTSPVGFYHSSNAWAEALLNPRLHVGAVVNTSGLTSYGFAGLTWRGNVFDRIFVEGEFGGAVNNAPSDVRHDRITIGCAVTFRESAAVGYQISSNLSILTNVEHISHANLCGDTNPGLTDFGVKLGYRF